jgi:hypothetical protein
MAEEFAGLDFHSIRLKERFEEEGCEGTVEGKEGGYRQRSIQGENEALLIVLICGPVPEGYAQWTLRLLRDKWVSLENTDTKEVSHETIRKIVKKTEGDPQSMMGLKQSHNYTNELGHLPKILDSRRIIMILCD